MIAFSAEGGTFDPTASYGLSLDNLVSEGAFLWPNNLVMRTALAAIVLTTWCDCVSQAWTVDVAIDAAGQAQDDVGVAVEPFIESGYLIFYNGMSPIGGWAYAPHVMLVDSSGSVLWDEYFVPEPEHYGWHFSAFGGVDHMVGSGYAACGTVTDSMGKHHGVLLKLDQWGNEEWRRYHSGTVNGVGFNEAVFTQDGGCLVLGIEFYSGSTQSILVKYDSVGNELWSSSIGPTGSGGHASGILPLADNGFMVCGQKYQSVGGLPWYSRRNGVGDLVWEHALQMAEYDASLHCIRENGNGGFVVLGRADTIWSDQNTWHRDFYMAVDSIGNVAWATRIGTYSQVEAALGFEVVDDLGLVGFGFGTGSLAGAGGSLSGYTIALGLNGDSLAGLRFAHAFDEDSLTYMSRVYDMFVDTVHERLLYVGGAKGAPFQGWVTDEDVWIATALLNGPQLFGSGNGADFLGISSTSVPDGTIFPVPTVAGHLIEWSTGATGLAPNRLQVSSSDGRNVDTGARFMERTDKVLIETACLSPGTYVVRAFFADGSIHVARFIILDA